MITARAIDPYEGYDPYAEPVPDYAAAPIPKTAPTPEPAWTPPEPTPEPVYTPPPTSRVPAPTTAPQEPAAPAYTPPPVPQQLPDGGGGAIPVPPPELAPSGVIPTPTPIPTIPAPEPVAPAPEPPPINRVPEPEAPAAPPIVTDPGTPPPSEPSGPALPPWVPPVPEVPNPFQPPPEEPAPLPEAPPIQIGEGEMPPPMPLPGPVAAPEEPLPPPVDEVPPPEDTMPTPPPTTQPAIDPVTGLPVSQTPGEPATYNPPPPTDTFTADDNLINTEILPTADPRVTEQQQAGDAGLQAQDIAPDIAPPGADPRLLKFQGMTDDLLAKLQSQPDRLGLAKQYYDTFEAETEPDYLRSLTAATDLGAAHGRLGSGILTNSYGDLAERRLRDKEVQKQNLLNAATEGTIGDRQRMFENLSAAEANAFGEAGANTNELQQERDARRALITQHYTNADKAIADAAAARGEQRGERGYQQGLAERALLARIQQQIAEGTATQQDFDNAMAMFGAGNTGDPGSAYDSAAAAAGLSSGQSAEDIALLLRLLGQRQAGAAGGAAVG